MINNNLLCTLSTASILSLIIAKMLRNTIKKFQAFWIDGLLLLGSLFILLFFKKSTWVCVLILFWGLFILSLTDIFYRSLPNVINMFLLSLGLVLSMQEQFVTNAQALWGSFIGYSVLWMFSASYQKLTGKLAMGNGDLKLASALGAWIGVSNIPYLFFWSSFLGTLFYGVMLFFRKCTRMYKIPFGLFLSISGMGIFILRVASC
jgi:leader peptidase (prepilin peptidase)/N-methyltransferase